MMFFKKKFKPIEITIENFNSEVFNSEKPILLDFYADWCQPCQVMKSLVNRLAKERKSNEESICLINLDANPNVAKMFSIRSVPTVLFIYKKKVHLRQVGLLPYNELLDSWLEFLEDIKNGVIE